MRKQEVCERRREDQSLRRFLHFIVYCVSHTYTQKILSYLTTLIFHLSLIFPLRIPFITQAALYAKFQWNSWLFQLKNTERNYSIVWRSTSFFCERPWGELRKKRKYFVCSMNAMTTPHKIKGNALNPVLIHGILFLQVLTFFKIHHHSRYLKSKTWNVSCKKYLQEFHN